MSEAKKVLEQAVECWNARDRGGWAALYTKDVFTQLGLTPGATSS